MKTLRIIIFSLVCSTAMAQTGAKLTDRFLVKTDVYNLILRKAFDIELESKLTKHISASLGLYSENSKQNLLNKSLTDFTDEIGKYKVTYTTKSLEGRINRNAITWGLRLYTNKMFMAPFGAYLMYSGSKGKADIQSYKFIDNFSAPVFDIKRTPSPAYLTTLNDISVTKYNFMIGNQNCLGERFYYDFSMGLQFCTLDITPEEANSIWASMSYLCANVIGEKYTDGVIGIECRFGISYLIY